MTVYSSASYAVSENQQTQKSPIQKSTINFFFSNES